MFCHGAKVGFYQGDISLLMDDIKTLKPTFFPVVPRLLNRIYDKVSERIQFSSVLHYLGLNIEYFKSGFPKVRTGSVLSTSYLCILLLR